MISKITSLPQQIQIINSVFNSPERHKNLYEKNLTIVSEATSYKEILPNIDPQFGSYIEFPFTNYMNGILHDSVLLIKIPKLEAATDDLTLEGGADPYIRYVNCIPLFLFDRIELLYNNKVIFEKFPQFIFEKVLQMSQPDDFEDLYKKILAMIQMKIE